jgi:hypothetical protein
VADDLAANQRDRAATDDVPDARNRHASNGCYSPRTSLFPKNFPILLDLIISRMEGKFIAYYRVSTDHQGVNGNGMAAQRKAVGDYLNGGCWKLVGEFTEVESGKRSDRPELEKALKACRKALGVKLGGPRTARNQRNATGGRPGASTGHCADSLGVGWNVGPLRGCGVERAPGRDAKRRAVVCQDRHPSARAVGSLGEANKHKQSVMDFAMSDPGPGPSPCRVPYGC